MIVQLLLSLQLYVYNTVTNLQFSKYKRAFFETLLPYTPTYYSYCCIKCCKSGLFLIRSISLSTIYITYDFYHLKFSKKSSSSVPVSSQIKPCTAKHCHMALFFWGTKT